MSIETEHDANLAFVEGLVRESAALREEVERLRGEVQKLAGLLSECADEFSEASAYKGEYLAEKHGDAESVARYRVAAAEAFRDRQ